MVPKRDKTNHKESTWPRSGVSAVMYSVGSHDLFLALCHRTVPSERGEEEALLQLILSLKKHLHLQPASARGEPDSHYCHYVAENELCVCGECPDGLGCCYLAHCVRGSVGLGKNSIFLFIVPLYNHVVTKFLF